MKKALCILVALLMAGNCYASAPDFRISDNSGNVLSVNSDGSLPVTVSGDFPIPDANITFLAITDDIETAITNATAGDTLILASGTYTVTDDIDVTKAVNIVGQGIGKTTIACATASKNVLDISASNVRIADMTISNTGGSGQGIYITVNNLSGIVFENLVVDISGSGTNYGVRCDGSSYDANNVVATITSSNTAARAFFVGNSSSTTANVTVNIRNVRASSDGTGGDSNTIYSYNGNDANTITINVYSSFITALAGNTNDCALYSTSLTTNTSTINAYSCVLNGQDYDVVQTGTNVLTLSGCTLVNNKISGTINFGTNDAWGTWTSTLAWASATPASAAQVARYKIANGMCHFSLYISSSDSNATVGLGTFTLPVTPRDNNTYIPINIMYEVNAVAAACEGLAYIDATTPSATVTTQEIDSGSHLAFNGDGSLIACIDGQPVLVYISGFYEI